MCHRVEVGSGYPRHLFDAKAVLLTYTDLFTPST
jgi:hypothetical protein